MDSYRTEEEQVEALKKWWEENGRSTLIAIVGIVAIGFGWQGWQSHSVEQAEASSTIYQDLMEALESQAQPDASEDSNVTAKYLAGVLKSDYAGSTYSHYAALSLAKLAVEANDHDTAEVELRWVLSNRPNQDVALLSQQRLARVMAAKGQIEQALKILDSIDSAGFTAAYEETRGDIYLQLGEKEKALAAYQRAALDTGKAKDKLSFLDMKLINLSPEMARAIDEVEISDEGGVISGEE